MRAFMVISLCEQVLGFRCKGTKLLRSFAVGDTLFLGCAEEASEHFALFGLAEHFLDPLPEDLTSDAPVFDHQILKGRRAPEMNQSRWCDARHMVCRNEPPLT